MSDCDLFTQVFLRRASAHPNRPALAFVSSAGDVGESKTYRDVLDEVRGIAEHLRSIGAEGERVCLAMPSSMDYMLGFLGCLFAGATPVCVNAPRARRSLDPLANIVSDAGARFCVIDDKGRERVLDQAGDYEALSSLRWIAPDDWKRRCETDLTPPTATGDTLAYLQYSSGSTSTPKGVMVSHGSLIANLVAIQAAKRLREGFTQFGWLPLNHDMGLVGQLLLMLWLGGRFVCMAPESFAMQPMAWMKGLSRFRANVTGGPNIAYEICANRATEADIASLDLSSLHTVSVGSEPIQADTLEKFARVFEPCGFKAEAFFPCYGLAESTLFVSGERYTGTPQIRDVPSNDDRHYEEMSSTKGISRALSCGTTAAGHRVRIVDPETQHECPTGSVGEVCVRGPSVTLGYWRAEEITKRTFDQVVAARDGSSEGGYLRTGDLGFVEDDRIYIVGRIKDVIIVDGRNLIPQDVERTVESAHEHVLVGGAAAFAIEEDRRTRLVVAVEIHRAAYPRKVADAVFDPAPLSVAIKRAVLQNHDLTPGDVVLLRQGALLRTTSGKLRRSACRNVYSEDAFDRLNPRLGV